MNISEVEQRRILADNDQMKKTITLIANVVVDDSFTVDEKLELVGRATGVIDNDVNDGEELEEV